MSDSPKKRRFMADESDQVVKSELQSAPSFVTVSPTHQALPSPPQTDAGAKVPSKSAPKRKASGAAQRKTIDRSIQTPKSLAPPLLNKQASLVQLFEDWAKEKNPKLGDTCAQQIKKSLSMYEARVKGPLSASSSDPSLASSVQERASEPTAKRPRLSQSQTPTDNNNFSSPTISPASEPATRTASPPILAQTTTTESISEPSLSSDSPSSGTSQSESANSSPKDDSHLSAPPSESNHEVTRIALEFRSKIEEMLYGEGDLLALAVKVINTIVSFFDLTLGAFFLATPQLQNDWTLLHASPSLDEFGYHFNYPTYGRFLILQSATNLAPFSVQAAATTSFLLVPMLSIKTQQIMATMVFGYSEKDRLDKSLAHISSCLKLITTQIQYIFLHQEMLQMKRALKQLSAENDTLKRQKSDGLLFDAYYS